MDHPPRGLAATPWPAEDGGPRRTQVVDGIPGPRAGGARLAAVRQAPLTIMVLLAPDERVLVLRAEPGGAASWVEDVDPLTLEVVGRSPDLPCGPFWPGGAAVLDDGSVLVVQGRWAHRLAPDLTVLAARELPIDAAHNSFVLLGDGTVATKDLSRPDGSPSTLSLLDLATLEDRAAPVVLPEPSVARLSADGDDLVVVGVTTTSVHRWDSSGLSPVRETTYRTRTDQSFGWDAVVEAGAVWWLDNGDHTFIDGFTMLGNGVAEGPVRLWRAPVDGGPATSVEVCGTARGAVTNPPLVDASRDLVLGFDSANGVLAAFATTDLAPVWSTPLRTAQHMWLYPDTGEVVADDHDPAAGDAVVVLDVATGEVRARCAVDSPAQSVVFGAPGRHRDVYYASLSTVARVELTD